MRLDVNRLVALAAVVVIVGCGGDDATPDDPTTTVPVEVSTAPLPTTSAGEVELCALASTPLPGSAEQPATNDQLASSLTERASIMARIADTASGDLADALRMSGEAMNRVAEAVASETDPNALDGLLSTLSSDADFAAAQETIDEAVSSACAGGGEG